MKQEACINPLAPLLVHLRCRQVRDLAVSCFGANLMDTSDSLDCAPYETTLTRGAQQWLRALDRQPEPLLAHLRKCQSTRLGVYFENLWTFYWQTYSDSTLIAHNEQIHEHGRTLGAFDFLLREPDGGFVHVEAAVKFYLGWGEDLRRWRAWIGPNANDRLADKLSHLQSQQLPLLHTDAAQEFLAARDIEASRVQQKLLLKGYLFPPAHNGSAALPGGANPDACSQRWWYLRDICAATLEGYYSIVPRNHWLAPVTYPLALQPLGPAALKRALRQQVGTKVTGRMVARLSPLHGAWHEVERLCVVADHWPATETPSRST